MNEKQSQQLQELETLETAGTIDDVQKERLAELKEIKVLSDKAKASDTLQVQKEKFREKAEKEEAEKKALEEKLNAAINASGQPPQKAALDVVDYIDISTSLDGLDQREKAYIAEQHKLSSKPLKDIREGEDFQLWQSAYRAKQEKEKALKPNGTQPVEPPQKSVTEKLATASLAEKEAMLKEMGLYKEPRPHSGKANIGPLRTG